MRRLPFSRAAILAVALVSFAGCGDSVSDTRERTALQQLQQNQRVWSDAGVRSYTVDVLRVCECSGLLSGPVRVEVTNGVVTGRTLVASGADVPAASHTLYPGVDGLFEAVRETILRNPRTMQIDYDDVLGYPLTLRAAFSLQSGTDDIVMEVRNFTPR